MDIILNAMRLNDTMFVVIDDVRLYGSELMKNVVIMMILGYLNGINWFCDTTKIAECRYMF